MHFRWFIHMTFNELLFEWKGCMRGWGITKKRWMHCEKDMGVETRYLYHIIAQP